jgi:hypothetical protein
MVGKLVYGDLYIHRSALHHLDRKDQKRVGGALTSIRLAAPKAAQCEVIVLRKDGTIQFVESPDWDTNTEPTVGDRISVKKGKPLAFRAASKKNPQIFHRRHTFVGPDYDGFDIEQDKAWVKKWEAHSPDTRRMGRREWWDEFLTKNRLRP